MMTWLIAFSGFVAGSVRMMGCLLLLSRLLFVKEPAKQSITTVAVGAAVISVLLSVTGLSDFYRMTLEILLIVCCASYFQRADRRMSLFVGIFYEIAVFFWQFLFAAWLGVGFRSAAFLDYGTGAGQVAVWCLHLSLFVLLLYLLKRPNLGAKEGFRLASAIVIAGFLAVVSLSQQTVLVIADDTLEMWTILAVVLLMAVLVFNMNRQYEVEKELAALKSQQAELLERDYAALHNAYAINAKLFHDFHNHIGVLRQLLVHDKTEEAVQYLDALQAPVRELTDRCGQERKR